MDADHGDRQRNDKLDNCRQVENRTEDQGLRGAQDQLTIRHERPGRDDRHRACDQCRKDGRETPLQCRRGGHRQIPGRHRAGNPGVAVERADHAQPVGQEHARDHRHHDRFGQRGRHPPDQPGQGKHQDKSAGDDIGADQFRHGKVHQCRAHDHDARHAVTDGQRLAVQITDADRQYPTEPVGGEKPGRDDVIRQRGGGADRENHGPRPGRRKQESTETVDEIVAKGMSQHIAQARQRPDNRLDRRCHRGFMIRHRVCAPFPPLIADSANSAKPQECMCGQRKRAIAERHRGIRREPMGTACGTVPSTSR